MWHPILKVHLDIFDVRYCALVAVIYTFNIVSSGARTRWCIWPPEHSSLTYSNKLRETSTPYYYANTSLA